MLEDHRDEKILASDVIDSLGALLLPAGSTVTLKHLEALGALGVPEIHLEELEEAEPTLPPADVLNPEAIHRATEGLSAPFGNIDRRHPFMGLLFLLAAVRAARQQQD